jgi:hypothetical protein
MWDASKCDLCGDCLVKCLYVDYNKNKAMTEIKALREGKEADILSTCITCCACREYCSSGADPYDLIVKAQEKFEVFHATKNKMDLAFEIPSVVIPGDPTKPILSLCVTEKYVPTGALDGQLFEGMGIVKGGDYFCLIAYVHGGQESPIAKNAQKFIDKLNALNTDIIFLHDDCYAMVHAKIKDYGITVPFRYKHLLEYVRNYLRDHQNSIKPIRRKVAFQRPCASRYTPEKDIFLDEIFDLIEVERVARKVRPREGIMLRGPDNTCLSGVGSGDPDKEYRRCHRRWCRGNSYALSHVRPDVKTDCCISWPTKNFRH